MIIIFEIPLCHISISCENIYLQDISKIRYQRFMKKISVMMLVCGSDSNGLILGTWPQAVVDAHHPTI